MSDKSGGGASNATKVAVIGGLATIVATLITVVGPGLVKSSGDEGGSNGIVSPTPGGDSSPSAGMNAHPDINLPAESVSAATGVLPPPTNPMTEYQALTSAWRRTGDGRLEPIPPSPDAPRRLAQWVVDAPPGVYRLLATYANGSQPQEDRSLDVAVNGQTVMRGKFGTVTGGWLPQDRVYDEPLGEVRLKNGTNVIEISCPSYRNFPHVSSLKLQYLRP